MGRVKFVTVRHACGHTETFEVSGDPQGNALLMKVQKQRPCPTCVTKARAIGLQEPSKNFPASP
jgi:hypothetical protein